MTITPDTTARSGDDPGDYRPSSTHFGVFTARNTADGLDVRDHPLDAYPSPLLDNIASAAHHPARIREPVIRRSWLEHGPGPRHRLGDDEFVAVGWEKALDLAAEELDRVKRLFGNSAIYGGSYGWSSAGRFHHAQSQVHRFLNCIGGYVRSVQSYSNGAATVILPHVVGSGQVLLRQGPTWEQVATEGELVVSFGGIPLKNTSVTPGGMTRHLTEIRVEECASRGVEFDIISPLRDDTPPGVTSRWFHAHPGTDVAVMLGIAHTLIEQDLVDHEFLDNHCVGSRQLLDYITGVSDGVAKTVDWAASISGLDASELAALARRMASRRTLINVTWSLQRIQHGEQPIWMGIALAAMLGQIGLAGGGFAHGLGSMGDSGEPKLTGNGPTFPQGRNDVPEFIPVARIADMLLNPGTPFDYNGETHLYPDIKLAYWSGGNPFHHHQDLNRLRKALGKLDTFIVHEPYWTATARHADIVFPTTIALERDDLGAGRKDSHITSMAQIMQPFGESRDDYDIFCSLAQRLDVGPAFSEARSSGEWLQHIYNEWRNQFAEADAVPSFEELQSAGIAELPTRHDAATVLFEKFRSDPEANPLATPSGRIELYSETIAGFDYEDCPGHPTWLEPAEYLLSPMSATYPLHLIANQPATRLHGQLDMGDLSMAAKVAGREPMRMNPFDAEARDITDGDVVRVFNERGACLAGVVISDDLMASVVQLPTGAWFDPFDASDPGTMCVHGNPNMVTTDRGTSRLAQGCTGQHALVQVEVWTGEVPPVRAHQPPTVHRPGATPSRFAASRTPGQVPNGDCSTSEATNG